MKPEIVDRAWYKEQFLVPLFVSRNIEKTMEMAYTFPIKRMVQGLRYFLTQSSDDTRKRKELVETCIGENHKEGGDG